MRLDMNKIALFLLILVVTTTYSCDKDNSPPTSSGLSLKAKLLSEIQNPPNYANPNFPTHFTAALNTDNNPSSNPVTDKGAYLGRVLFYDTQLSINNTVSCASCHKQTDGFTDKEVFSIGFEGGLTGMHSMRLANGRFYAPSFQFWDRRAANQEEQSVMPIEDAIEMGFDSTAGGLNALITRLEGLDYYPALFQEVFGSNEINVIRIEKAIAQFLRSIVAFESKFDEGYAFTYNSSTPGFGLDDYFPNFNESENRGKHLFVTPARLGGGGCNDCHQAPAFTLDGIVKSNGLDANETRIFKSPSLSNVAVAGGYMHDGRFATLEEVLEHYNTGVLMGPALDPLLIAPNNTPLQLNLTNRDKQDLIAFLKTLTDNKSLSDPKYSNPFL